jgi:hypothetical protein
MGNGPSWSKQLLSCGMESQVNLSVVYSFFLKVTLITYTAPPELCPNFTCVSLPSMKISSFLSSVKDDKAEDYGHLQYSL